MPRIRACRALFIVEITASTRPALRAGLDAMAALTAELKVFGEYPYGGN